MSHVAQVSLHILDLYALAAAAQTLGLELREGQTTYKWYGFSVGDYPLPTGFKRSDLGHCEHALGIPNNDKAYEIGVVTRRDGKPGYALLWDHWQGGFGLVEKVGPGCDKLKQAYSLEVAAKTARKQGFTVKREAAANGAVQLVCTK